MKKTFLSLLSLMLMATAFVSCGNNDGKTGDGEADAVPSLVGQWAYGSFVYDFQNDSVGSYCGTMNFKYKNSADSLYITYEGQTEPMALAYRLDGDKLIVTDSFGSDVEYVKK